MTDFFQGLSAIGDTLVKNRERNQRERTLADVGDLLGRPGPDYNALAAKLIAAGDIRNAVLVLRLNAMRKPERYQWPDSTPPAALPAQPEGDTAQQHDQLDEQFGSAARYLRPWPR